MEQLMRMGGPFEWKQGRFVNFAMRGKPKGLQPCACSLAARASRKRRCR